MRADTFANASVLASKVIRLSSKIATKAGSAVSLLSFPKATMALLAMLPARTSNAQISTASAVLSPMLPSAAAAASRTLSASNGFSTIWLSFETVFASFSVPSAEAARNRISACSSSSAAIKGAAARSSFSAPSEAAAAARMDFISSRFSRMAIKGSTVRLSLKPPSAPAARLRIT